MSDSFSAVIATTSFALVVGLAFIAGCTIHYGRQIIAPRVPMQWRIDGHPNWFAPRFVGLWFSFGFTAILSTLLLSAAVHEPQKLTAMVFAVVIVTATNMWMQVYHLKRVIRWQPEPPADEPGSMRKILQEPSALS